MKRHFLALLLSLAMIISLLPVTAMAEDSESDTPPTSGYCGGDTSAGTFKYSWQGVEKVHGKQTVYQNIAWTLVQNGSNDAGTTYKLVLTGSGPMFDFTQKWYSKLNEDIVSTGAETDEPWWDWRLQITEVDIADGITTIGKLGFYALSLESIEIPDSVISIGQSAVADNHYLKSAVIGAGVKTITALAFNRAYELETLTFRDGEDLTIGDGAFFDSKIETLVIPSRVRSIAARAFGSDKVHALKKVIFEENTNLTLGSSVFENSTTLMDVDMSAVDSDGNNMGSVFNNCTALENVKLPTGSHFTKLPAQMFWKCSALKTVVIPANITGWGYQVFDSTGVHTLVFETQNMATNEKDCGVNFVMGTTAEKVVIYTQKPEDTNAYKTGEYKSGIGDKQKQINAVTNGGTFPADTVFVEGVLAEPVLKDHIFEGWYTSASCETGTKLEDNAAPVVDTIYYAKWADCDHSVSYTAKDNVITERCGCGSVMNTLTLNAPEDLTYDGTAKECMIEKSEGWQELTDVTVEYYSGADKLSGAPTNAGEYTAKVTVQGATASVNFTIAKAEQNISYATASVSKRVGAANFTNELTKTLADGAISYASSDESVAKVNAATGEVTIIGVGRATITATAAETANYNEATASYTLTVTRRHSSPSTPVTPEPEPTPEETVKFADVSTSAYYYDVVKWAVESGVTDGLTDTTFGPYESCTRAQIVTFLWRAAGSPEPKTVSSFTDVPASAYYAEAVAWAVENGITNGVTATEFAPDATCTRGQSVTFLYRALGKKVESSANFTDVKSDAFYADAVNWAVASDVTNGTSATTFSPNADCTRAEIVTFLYRAYQGK